jgi:GTP:adenosylcobinamide-phosphate guanylyltransferase
MPETPVTIILLAGQRAGVVNPLAERAGVSHKCLVPIRGKPLIAHVLDTLTALPAIREIRISLEPEAHDEVRKLAAAYAGSGIPIALIPTAPRIVESLLAATGEEPGPWVVTTADNVLLTGESFEQVRADLAHDGGVFALARKKDVLAAHPDGQRGFYQFKDDAYANCNIYGIADRRTLTSGSELFRGGGQFMKSVMRMIRAFGLLNILLLRLGVLDREHAIRRLSARIGVDIRSTVFSDGSQAIDVDNERTYRVCEELLARREAA